RWLSHFRPGHRGEERGALAVRGQGIARPGRLRDRRRLGGAHGLRHRGVDRTRDRRHRWRRGRQHRTGDHPVRAHPKRRGAAGLSLIELMIALAIGSLLILAPVAVLAAARLAYILATCAWPATRAASTTRRASCPPTSPPRARP